MDANINIKEEYQRVIDRIYHEDSLFSQRVNYLLQTHAFLAAAFALSLPSSDAYGYDKFLLPYLVTLFGLGLSVFFIPIGYRSYKAVQFWRIYVQQIELSLGIKMDCALYEFFQTGYTETQFGKIGPREPNKRPMMQVFPWSFKRVRSTSMWLGVMLPLLLTMFWVAALASLTPLRLFSISGIALTIIVMVILLLTGRLQSTNPIVLSKGE